MVIFEGAHAIDHAEYPDGLSGLMTRPRIEDRTLEGVNCLTTRMVPPLPVPAAPDSLILTISHAIPEKIETA
jgi:hypothetical protein